MLLVLTSAYPYDAEESKKAAPQPKTKAEYDAYIKIYNSKDMKKRALLAPQFIDNFPESDYRLAAYQLEIQANAALGNHEKVVSVGETAVSAFPKATKKAKMYILQKMMYGYKQLNNSHKTVNIADTILTLDHDYLPALLILSLVLPEFLPDEEEPRAQQLQRALKMTQRAKQQIDSLINGAKPARISAAQWAKQKSELPAKIHSALGLIYFKKRDYQLSSKEYEQATSLVRGEGIDFYRMGISYYQQARAIDRELTELVEADNLDLVAKEKKETDFTAARDKAINSLAKVIVVKDSTPEAVVQAARDDLELLYKNKNKESLEGLELVIADAARDLQISP